MEAVQERAGRCDVVRTSGHVVSLMYNIEWKWISGDQLPEQKWTKLKF